MNSIMNRIFIFDNVPFDTLTKDELIDIIIQSAMTCQMKKIFNMNAYGVTVFKKNPAYAKAINSADLIYPDGWGPVLVSKFTEKGLNTRLNVGDFIDELLIKIEQNKFKIYLLGCELEIIDKTVKSIRKEYPKIKISGYHHGFFDQKEETQIINDLVKKKPHVVFIGMGIPNQEIWIYENFHRLPPAIYMGVGGVFYYISNTKSRAPMWMRKFGLEWLYRFIQEPNRLGKRYTFYNFHFIYYFLIGFLKSKIMIRK